jgi:hypothetical protein
MNSRNPFAKGFKKPLYLNDIEKQKSIVLPLIEYLLKLTDVKGTPLCLTPRKTFVIGKLINNKSTNNIILVFRYHA